MRRRRSSAGCTKGAETATETFCGALSTLGGTHLTNYTCVDAAPKGCLASAEPGQWCCNDAPAETYAQPYCKRITREIKAGPKQWGAGCNATAGLENNVDCDSAQGFFCYGTSPADGAAYCTRYDCHADSECAASFYCATINVAPNVTTTKPTIHKTTTVCLRRDYCAPCTADLDCPPLNGRTQHCVPDDNSVGFCAPECSTSQNCPHDAKCVDGGIGIKTCYPRAGTCVGDGSLCSPCRNDADCGDDGACVKGQYTTERSCAKKSGTRARRASAGHGLPVPGLAAPEGDHAARRRVRAGPDRTTATASTRSGVRRRRLLDAREALKTVQVAARQRGPLASSRCWTIAVHIDRSSAIASIAHCAAAVTASACSGTSNAPCESSARRERGEDGRRLRALHEGNERERIVAGTRNAAMLPSA